MASDVARDLEDNILGTRISPANRNVPNRLSAPDTLNRPPNTLSQHSLVNSFSYVWATNDSTLSRDVDRWIGGDSASPVHIGHPNMQGRLATAQRSSVALPSAVDSTGFWYLTAMMLPLFGLTGRCRNWGCTPSTVLNTVELLLTQVAGYCGQARARLRRLTHEQGRRDIFAGLMDVILVVYAFGFLLLSMYQASMFQQF